MHKILCNINANSAYAKTARTIGAASRTTSLAQRDRSYAVIYFDTTLPLSQRTHLALAPPPIARLHHSAKSNTACHCPLLSKQTRAPSSVLPRKFIKDTTSTASISTSSRTSTLSSSVSTSLSQPPPPSPSSTTAKATTKHQPTTKSKKGRIAKEWEADDDAIMLALSRDHGIGWRDIGQLFDRAYTTCFTRYTRNIKPALKSGWIPVIQDQARLQKLIQEGKALLKKKSEAALEAKKTVIVTEVPKKRIQWDPVTDKLIIDMVESGIGWPEIGQTLRRPYSSCYTRYYLTLDPALEETWSPEAIKELDELASQGLSWKDIGRRLKLRPVVCRARWIKEGKVTFPTVSPNPVVEIPSTTINTTDKVPGMEPELTKSTLSFFKQESCMIARMVREHGEDNWDLILEKFRAERIQEITSAGGPISGRRSKEKARLRILSIRVPDLLYHFKQLSRGTQWTIDQETILIQHVLQLGTEGHWDEITHATKALSSQDCRTHWKNLDMPVRLNLSEWSQSEQLAFLAILREFGPDFNRLSKFTSSRTPADCQKFFEKITKDFPDRQKDLEGFNKKVDEYIESISAIRLKYWFTKNRSLKLQHTIQYYFKKSGMTYVPINAWDWIADKVQRGMTPSSCMEHWMYLRSNLDVVYGPLNKDQVLIKPQVSSSWSHEELKLLDQGVREYGTKWKDIQERHLPWRTTKSIRQRWLTMSDKATKVTEDEYYTIVGAGDLSSEIDYDALRMRMPGWNRLPCRRIFETSYKHLIANTVWLPEEDRLLLKMVLKESGRNWDGVAKHFNGIRTARAPLYAEAMARMPPTPTTELPMRTHKTAWQCQLRWSQLLIPMMPIGSTMPVRHNHKSYALMLSKQLLDQYNGNNGSGGR